MIRIFMLLSMLVALTACGGGNARTSIASEAAEAAEAAETVATANQSGTYTGTLPAADCPGIAFTLNLCDDGSYTSRSEYLERDITYNEQGRFEIEGERLTLHPDEGEPTACYRIEENSLRLLDSDGRPVAGALADHYVLTRKTDR